MDYTLSQYKPETFEKLAHDLTVEKLVSVFGYPEVTAMSPLHTLSHTLLASLNQSTDCWTGCLLVNKTDAGTRCALSCRAMTLLQL